MNKNLIELRFWLVKNDSRFLNNYKVRSDFEIDLSTESKIERIEKDVKTWERRKRKLCFMWWFEIYTLYI